MTMKRLMIMAAMMTVLACGDEDSSGGDDGDDSTEEQPVKDAGKADAKVDASKADAGKNDAAAGNECLPLNYASFGKAFEEKYCASCHAASVKGNDRKGAPPEEVFDTLAQIKAAKADLKTAVVEDESMPFPLPNVKIPTAAEREQFGKFLDCGPN